MKEPSVLLRARVPEKRYRNAEKILGQLGINPGDAVNLLMAQIELQKGMLFKVTLNSPSLLTTHEQAAAWEEALGEY